MRGGFASSLRCFNEMGVDESSARHSSGSCWVKGHQGLKSSDNPSDSRQIGAAAVSAVGFVTVGFRPGDVPPD